MTRRPGRFLWLVCLMALAFGLCACQEESAPKAALDKETASAVVAKAAAGLQAPEAPAPAEEAAAAARVLDAGNAVWRWADVAGIHAGHLLRQAEDYMRTWLLGKEPQRPAELDDRPAVEKSVWGEADAARLRDLMATMRRTLTSMEKLGTAFRKYALDDSIVDDGAQGRMCAIYRKVHPYFGRGRQPSLQHIAVQVHADQHILCHISLRNAGRRHPDAVFTGADADIPVISGHIPPLIHPPANVQNRGPGLTVCAKNGHNVHLTFSQCCFLWFLALY